MAFSESLIQFDVSNSPSVLRLAPALYSRELIGSEWTKIEGCWRADRDYEYLLIGNFKPDSTRALRVLPQQQDEIAYYLIDDVLVEQLRYDVPDLESVAGFCPDQQSVELDATTSHALGYLWENRSEGSKRIITSRADKKYFVDILFPECSFRKSFTVLDFPPIRYTSLH
jgi:hypothetical protein